jgi:hypothetical protein
MVLLLKHIRTGEFVLRSWFYDYPLRVGIHRGNFIFDLWNSYLQPRLYIILPTNIDLWNLYYFILVGNWVVSSLFDSIGKCGDAWKLEIYDGLWIPRKKGGNLQAEIYCLLNLYFMYKISQNMFLSVDTNSRSITLKSIKYLDEHIWAIYYF